MEISEKIDTLLLVVASILLFLGAQVYLKSYIEQYPWFLILLGSGIIFFRKNLTERLV